MLLWKRMRYILILLCGFGTVQRMYMQSIVKIDSKENHIFKNLQLCYECEFAPITKTNMTVHADYDQAEIASHWAPNYSLYLFYHKAIPVGFCVVNHQSMLDGRTNVNDIAEFFIVPLFRKSGLGIYFATQIFRLFPGEWEVRQLPELEHTARKFWLKVIHSLPVSHFEEKSNYPPWGGFVQQFTLEK